MSQSIEQIALKAVNDTELMTLKHCLKIIKEYPRDMVIEVLENRIKELENE